MVPRKGGGQEKQGKKMDEEPGGFLVSEKQRGGRTAARFQRAGKRLALLVKSC